MAHVEHGPLYNTSPLRKSRLVHHKKKSIACCTTMPTVVVVGVAFVKACSKCMV